MCMCCRVLTMSHQTSLSCRLGWLPGSLWAAECQPPCQAPLATSMALTCTWTPRPRGGRGLSAECPEGLGAEASGCQAGAGKTGRSHSLSVLPACPPWQGPATHWAPQCPGHPLLGVVHATVLKTRRPQMALGSPLSADQAAETLEPGPAVTPIPCQSPGNGPQGLARSSAVSPVTMHTGTELPSSCSAVVPSLPPHLWPDAPPNTPCGRGYEGRLMATPPWPGVLHGHCSPQAHPPAKASPRG